LPPTSSLNPLRFLGSISPLPADSPLDFRSLFRSDAAAMKEKKAAKDIEKSALASSGEEGAAQVAADEKRKAEFRLKQKDNKLANHNPQLAKQLRNANK